MKQLLRKGDLQQSAFVRGLRNVSLVNVHDAVVGFILMMQLLLSYPFCIEWQTKIRHINLSHCLQDAQTEGMKDGITRHREGV